MQHVGTQIKCKEMSRSGLGGVGFGVERGELEADYPFGGNGVAIDLGGSKVPAMRGLQGLVREITARAGGEQLSRCNIAGGIDVKLDGNVHGATNGGARFRRNIWHYLREHLAVCHGAGGRRGGFGTWRIGHIGERGGRGNR